MPGFLMLYGTCVPWARLSSPLLPASEVSNSVKSTSFPAVFGSCVFRFAADGLPQKTLPKWPQKGFNHGMLSNCSKIAHSQSEVYSLLRMGWALLIHPQPLTSKLWPQSNPKLDAS